MRILVFRFEIFIHLQGSAEYFYVEVVMLGEIEGKFLEDPTAHNEETMGQVSKLGEF